jgi:hypothetical protein
MPADSRRLGWADAALLAGRSVRRRAGRAMLTASAVALAATLLVALLTLETTARTRVLSQLSHGGPLAGITVAAAEPNLSDLSSDNPSAGPPHAIDAQALATIQRLPGVASVVAVQQSTLLVDATAPGPSGAGAAGLGQPGSPVFIDSAVGVDLRHVSTLPISVLAGRLPTPGDPEEVAVGPDFLRHLGVASTAAATLLGRQIVLGAPQQQPPGVGVSYRGRWQRATIVGVVTQQVGGGDLVMTAGAVAAQRAWTQAGTNPDALGLSASPYAALFVVSAGLTDVAQVRTEIAQVGYTTSAPENLIATVLRYLHVVTIVLSGIGLIALVIAGLGITNALFAAVRERTREIGVLKAIGARDGDVLRAVLLEAALLGLVGGVVGTALGTGVAVSVGAVVNSYLHGQGLAGVRVGVPLWVALAGVLGAAALATVAGVAPSLRAARLPAREAVAAA